MCAAAVRLLLIDEESLNLCSYRDGWDCLIKNKVEYKNLICNYSDTEQLESDRTIKCSA